MTSLMARSWSGATLRLAAIRAGEGALQLAAILVADDEGRGDFITLGHR